MRTTTKRSEVGRRVNTHSANAKDKYHNISAKAVAAMEQAQLQEQKEQQERPEKQLSDLSERAIVDIAVSLEDIVRGNNAGRSGSDAKSQASTYSNGEESSHIKGVGRYKSGSESDQVETGSNGGSDNKSSNNISSPAGKEPETELLVTGLKADDDIRKAYKKGHNPLAESEAPAIDNPAAGSKGKDGGNTDGHKRNMNGSKSGRRTGSNKANQDKQVAQDQRRGRKQTVKAIPVATKAMEYAAEFNKETEELMRRAKQAKNTARAVKKTGETTVKVVKNVAKGVAWLARIAIATIKGMVTALLIGGAAAVPVVIIIAVLAAFISSPFSLFAGAGTVSDDEQADVAPAIAMNLPDTVLRYKPIVERECTEQGIPQYIDVILAIMMQESGGRIPDVMQSSASAGLPNNSLQPEASIKQGIKYFKSILDSAAIKNVDFDTSIQAYNYGIGFLDYVKGKGGVYSYEIASLFSDEQAKKLGVSRYGDKEYVPNVYRYLQGTGNVVLSDNPIGRHLNKLYAELYSKASTEAANLQGADRSEVNIGEAEGDATNNALEVLAIFAVRATIGAKNGDGYTLGEIGDEQLQVLTNVFWDMHSIETSKINKQITETDEDGNEVTKMVEAKTVTVIVKSAGEMAEQYDFDSSAKGALDEMLTDYRGELLAFVSVSPGGVDLSDAELAAIIRDLPAGDKGAAIVKVAFTRLGDPYSQDLRFQGKYIDCSGLTMWSYKQLGISIPGTAAEQGRFCVENNVIVSRDALVPSDLVFYSDKTNGRYMNITHVAIYVGDGMIIDASSTRGQVVYRKMYGKPILYGRPHIL